LIVGGGGFETAKLRITGGVAYLHSIVRQGERLYVSLGKIGNLGAAMLFDCVLLFVRRFFGDALSLTFSGKSC